MISANEQQERRARLLPRVLTAIAAILAVYIIAVFSLLPGFTPAKVAGFAAFLILATAAFASRYQRFYYASAISLLATILLGGFAASLTNGGLQGYVTPILLTAPVAAAVFLNKKYVYGVVGLLMVIFVAQLILEQRGLVSPTPYSEETVQIAALIMMATVTLICAAAIGFFTQQSDRNIKLLLDSQARLTQANAATHEQRLLAEQRKEQAEAAAETESRFFSTMSHEIRTPLNGVLGMAQVLENTKLDDQQKECLRVMQSCGESLLFLINDLLDLAKLDSGQYQISQRPVDFRSLIKSVEDVVQAEIAQKKLSYEAIINVDRETRYLGDEAVLKQILTNLVGNAVKFTDKGAITVLVEAADQDAIKFSVKDTGPGIDAKQHSKIFSRFRQADDEVTRDKGGTGLGLAICKKFVDLMGGDIGVHNNKTGGATFWFTTPMKSADKEDLSPVYQSRSQYIA